MKHPFIVIEGIDGVGKTTIANLLTEKLGAVYQRATLPSLTWIARLIDKFHNPEIETIGYFLLIVFTSLIVSRLLKRRPVVCDKYILTTIVAQTALGGKLIKLIKGIRYILVRKPDYTFCLTVSDRDRLMARLKQRGKINRNDEQLLPYWFKIQIEYHKFREVIVIDTTNRSPTEIINIILGYLKT